MTIRPRNVLKFLTGGSFDLDAWIKANPEYYKWYSSLYLNAPILLGNPLKQRNDNWNKLLLSSSHYTTDDLRRSAYNNYLYTNDYDARLEDLIRWGESQQDFGTISDQEFVDRYNQLAQKIREAREAPQTYNRTGYRGSNRFFRGMFYNRSKLGSNHPLYNIGYLDNIEDIEGTSTWQRRMDRYEKEFEDDTPEGQANRTFYITRPDGTKIKVYKKANGDIGLFPNNGTSIDPSKLSGVLAIHGDYNGPIDWNKISAGILKLMPNLLEDLRLGVSLNANNRIAKEKLKGIRPNLQSSYLTHRLVVGDEGTKQAYYTRAALGQTQAARPFTSDADRLMAYQMEAKSEADKLRALGDLVDNQEIRRTSDESNEHQWKNTARATDVANNNIIEINKANAAKHDILALEIAANHSSWDNLLRARETRLRERDAEEKLMLDQIFALQAQNDLEFDEELIDAKKRLSEAIKKHRAEDGTIDRYHPDILDALKYYKLLLNKKTREYYLALLDYRRNSRSGIFMAKEGSKITIKNKRTQDLLYKSARDTVEHFRKMSKMSDDSTQRSRPKGPIKLILPPTKMLLGGVAPFTVFTPVALGGERTTSSQVTSGGITDPLASKKAAASTAGKDKLDFVKSLFKEIDGLPIDVNTTYKAFSNLLEEAELFGTELSTDDLAGMYLKAMLQLNQIKFSKEVFDKARTNATQNEALNEFAITLDGRLVLLSKDGEISLGTLAEAKEKGLNPLTNNLLLSLRAYDPNFIFGKGDLLMEIVSNGIGMSKIGKFLKDQLPQISATEGTLQGYTKLDSVNIKEGIQLLKDAPAGDYKWSKYTKQLEEQAKAAIQYLAGILPNNMKSVLQVNAEMLGTTVANLIKSLVTSTLSYNTKLEWDKVSGNEDSINKLASNPLLAIQREMGGNPIRYSIVTRDSNTRISTNGTSYPALPKVDSDMSISAMLSTSGIGGIITNRRGITFGNLQIKPEDLNHIMYSVDGGGTVVTLPCKIVNGVKQVNLDVIKQYEEAELRALQISSDRNSLQFIQALGEELLKEHLDSLLDANGLPNKNMFAQFLLVEGYTTDKINFEKDSLYVEKVQNPDEALEGRMILALSTDKKKSNYSIDVKDHWGIFEGFYDDIYRGTVFIPLNNNPNAAINSWGGSANVTLSTELETLYQNANKSSKFNNNNSL